MDEGSLSTLELVRTWSERLRSGTMQAKLESLDQLNELMRLQELSAFEMEKILEEFDLTLVLASLLRLSADQPSQADLDDLQQQDNASVPEAPVRNMLNTHVKRAAATFLVHLVELGDPIAQRVVSSGLHDVLVNIGDFDDADGFQNFGERCLSLLFQSLLTTEDSHAYLLRCCDAIVSSILPSDPVSKLRYTSKILSLLSACLPDRTLGELLLPFAVQLLFSDDLEVEDNAARALRNLVTEYPDMVSVLLDQCVLTRLHDLVVPPTYVHRSDAILRILTLLVEHCQDPRVDSIVDYIPLYVSYFDQRFLPALACTLLGNLMDRPSRIQKVIEAGGLPRMLKCLSSQSSWVQAQAARAVAKFFTRGSDEQISYALTQDAIKPLLQSVAAGQMASHLVVLDIVSAVLNYGRRHMDGYVHRDGGQKGSRLGDREEDRQGDREEDGQGCREVREGGNSCIRESRTTNAAGLATVKDGDDVAGEHRKRRRVSAGGGHDRHDHVYSTRSLSSSCRLPLPSSSPSSLHRTDDDRDGRGSRGSRDGVDGVNSCCAMVKEAGFFDAVKCMQSPEAQEKIGRILAEFFPSIQL